MKTSLKWKMNSNRSWWLIRVSGYGDFAFWGTKEEAEEVCFHKSQWEGGVGTVSSKCSMEDSRAELNHLKWQLNNDYPLDKRELECLKLNS